PHACSPPGRGQGWVGRVANSKNQVPSTKEVPMNQAPKGCLMTQKFWSLGFGAFLELGFWSLGIRAAWRQPWVVALFACAVVSVRAGEPTKAQVDFFENKIRPIFAGNCYKCHSPAEGKIKGGLELDWKGGWEKGGENGPVIVPGSPEQSRLIQAVRYTDPKLQMPPKGEKLSETQISDLVAWVRMGAPDPRTTRPAETTAGEYGGNGKDHWAFKLVKKPALPGVQNDSWVRNDIDRFILAKPEANSMTPNDPAKPRPFIRRVYFHFIGLSPTPEQTDNSLNDDSPKACEKVGDKLL